ncbi:MAG: phosphoribosyl-ATP diphosphatase [Phycisphaeraceae bacterium]|nr:phosphoribosyl-ATP diphosphatase [Phycisphaeraceae bacterium]
MIIPSIDLMGGHTVQLVQGKRKVIDAGDPAPIARNFGLVGEIAVVDLDAALGKGTNESLIEPLLGIADCRVGGGIRDARSAIRWLDAGATRVVLGTRAVPEVLRDLPRERVIAALDARDGDVVTHGWTASTGTKIADRMRDLAEYAAEFLVTFVEVEGTMQGTNMERAAELGELARSLGCRLTVAGGVRSPEEIAALDRLGIDAQIGMALYTGTFTIADALLAMLRTDRPDGLFPTIVADERGAALGLAYSSPDSLRLALSERRGIYHSRSRAGIWRKGETSGDTQELLRVDLDCDRDTLRFTVTQAGGFCHTGTRTCFGTARGLASLESRLTTIARATDQLDVGALPHAPLTPPRSSAAIRVDTSSYTSRLLRDPSLLRTKLLEEAGELMEATERDHIAREAADVLYFTLARLAGAGVPLADVERELDRRARKVTRRPGNAKPPMTAPPAEATP